MRSKLTVFCLIACVLLAACSTDSTTNTAPEIGLGSEVAIHGGKTATFVAVDEETLSEMAKAIVAKDETGFDELKLSGRIFPVWNGTKALMIDRGSFGARRVRILEGDDKGRAAWVYESWVRASPAAPAR